MIRLMLLSFAVFSGVYFWAGEKTTSHQNYITQVSFDDDQNANLDAGFDQAQNTTPQIDISAFRASLKTLKINLKNKYQKAKKYLFPKESKSHQTAQLIVSSQRHQKQDSNTRNSPKNGVKNNNKRATSKKVKKTSVKIKKPKALSVESRLNTLPLPSARPILSKSQIIAMNTENTNFFGLKKRPVASFTDFVTAKPKRVKVAYAKIDSIKVSGANQMSPRFLTSLIKRELKRLNCFQGAITPSWNQAVQQRIKSLKQPLTSVEPSRAALSYLQNQKQLKCVKHQAKTARIAPVKMIKRAIQPSAVKTSSIILRDRSGKIILSDKMKQAAALKLQADKIAESQKAALDRQYSESLATGNDNDYNFATVKDKKYNQRPAALTVGMRSSDDFSGNLYQASFKPQPKKKIKKRVRKAKSKQWMNDAFND